jgi:hypothetical protein
MASTTSQPALPSATRDTLVAMICPSKIFNHIKVEDMKNRNNKGQKVSIINHPKL